MSVKLLLAGTFDDWHSLELTRQNQHWRNEAAKALDIIKSQIQNNGAIQGSALGLHWRFEAEPKREPETGEAA